MNLLAPKRIRLWLAALCFSAPAACAVSEDWARFRGPNGSGVSTDSKNLPAKFSSTENLKWRCELPGPGSSCPIVVGDKLFVTCWTGYGTPDAPDGKQADLRRHLICLDRATGKVVWDKAVSPELPEDEYGGMFAEHGFASHTPVSDGEHIYAYFGKSGAVAFDLDGNQLWQTKVGSELDPRRWGSASSPILYKDLLIVTATAESEALAALDKKTGKVVWKKEASGLNSCWGTPVLCKVDDERTDLVIGVPREIWGFDPETGKLRWYCQANNDDSFCSSVIVKGDVVYAIEGRGGGSIAVRAGGKGDVSSTHVVWSGQESNRIGTPLLVDNQIYFFGNRVANSIRTDDGSRVYQERMTGGDQPAAGGPPQGGPGPGAFGQGGPGQGGPAKVVLAKVVLAVAGLVEDVAGEWAAAWAAITRRPFTATARFTSRPVLETFTSSKPVRSSSCWALTV